MTTEVLDPKLQNLAAQIESAFAAAPSQHSVLAGGLVQQGIPSIDVATVTRDASSVAGALLSAYRAAAVTNPAKVYRPNGYAPTIQISSLSELMDRTFWDAVWNVLQTAGPVVVDALTREHRPEAPTLATIIQNVPAHRRDDKVWVDFTTSLLLNLGQGTVQALSGQKDFSNPANRPPIPRAPANADKAFYDDAFSFIQQAAPVALPIIMSMV